MRFSDSPGMKRHPLEVNKAVFDNMYFFLNQNAAEEPIRDDINSF